MSTEPPDEGRAALLAELARDDDAASARAFDRVYRQLRQVARRYLGGERRDHTLEPTDLVNEACLRLIPREDLDEVTRTRLLGHAARAMRQVLVDHARKVGTDKRGGGWDRVTLRGVAESGAGDGVSFTALAAALQKLEAEDPALAEITDWHYFGGMTGAEIARRRGVSRSTVTRELAFARALLLREIDRIESESP